MANIFSITVAATDIKADADGKAIAIFTVTNVRDTPVRGIARPKALGNTQQDWLVVKGESERDFSPHGTEQFTVEFSKPAGPATPGAAPEKFSFRLDSFSAANPDEEFTEGPTVNVEVKQPDALPPKKPFPWWILIVIGAVLLLVVILVVFLLSRGGGKPADNGNNAAPSPSTPVPVTFTLELSTDRAGNDYRLIELPQPTFELCRAECAKDAKCRAYSYVNPGVQAPNARCYLKAPVPAPSKNSCCISGVKN